MLSTPCLDSVDISSVYCMNVMHRVETMLVSTALESGRRRLLGVDETDLVPFNTTHNGLCRDALKYDTMPETRAECLAQYRLSRQTVHLLGLSNVSGPCVFCSMQDVWHEVRHNPAFALHLAAHPRKRSR